MRHHATPDGDIPFSPEEETARNIEEAEAVKDKEAYAKVKYKDDRKKDYPEFGDQLDALYHAGVFPKEMADKLKAVKDKYPKPE